MFFNSLLIENKKNIKVVSIKPGVIATPLWGKSIDENSKYFDNYGEYSQEMQYVIANARKNSTKGLSAEKVVDVILKADRLKNPKLSYIVGRDAFMANLISKLPQGVINSLVKTGIRLKMKNAK
jgi:short-subunit dehydrogenase